MPTTEVDVPDRMESDIALLVEQGEFLNQDKAYEELLTMGISAYGAAEETSDERREDVFNQRVDDHQDPAARSDESGEPYEL